MSIEQPSSKQVSEAQLHELRRVISTSADQHGEIIAAWMARSIIDELLTRRSQDETSEVDNLKAMLRAVRDHGCNECMECAVAINRLIGPAVKATTALPSDCSGEPTSCPDNEGTGCYCSRELAARTCFRSHPHENMADECQWLTEIARRGALNGSGAL